ncbi:uncharacterized protein K444DRAFT_29153 [Hyaloscypha bicolor E]|uniref:Uncharacterized protein n=1 Tax=Hyaloscypha bicolor E TaxID=1095630 RepID=A0A2J6T3C2_9HELO|nr:uncharacterized protein K444DRAFT_29153 [Hyaloscypha bicolor E]PMD57522.1 hypothetical protein K444DRAFT_29153 [Hyaloscypha bicolor E]
MGPLYFLTLFFNILAFTTASVLDKRYVQGIHLVNCGNAYSAIVYCAQDGSSACKKNPSSSNMEKVRSNGLFKWEGVASKQVTFSTGVTFSFTISIDAQSFSNNGHAGSGLQSYKNSILGTWNIKKDDGHSMYNDGNGNTCHSIYYALAV